METNAIALIFIESLCKGAASTVSCIHQLLSLKAMAARANTRDLLGVANRKNLSFENNRFSI
jgi:hypothetical protein